MDRAGRRIDSEEPVRYTFGMAVTQLKNASWVDLGEKYEVLAMAAPRNFETVASLGIQRVVYLLSTRGLSALYGSEEALAKRYLEVGITPYWVPTPNLGVPESVAPMQKALEFLNDGPTRTGAIHCQYGVGRTGLTLCCAMVKRGMVAQSATESLLRQRKFPLQSRSQLLYLSEFLQAENQP